jgi:hypothetical protein
MTPRHAPVLSNRGRAAKDENSLAFIFTFDGSQGGINPVPLLLMGLEKHMAAAQPPSGIEAAWSKDMLLEYLQSTV